MEDMPGGAFVSLLVLASLASAADPFSSPGGCPPGQRTVSYELGKTTCTTDGAPPAIWGALPVHCPKGFEPSNPGGGRRMRCVPRAEPDADADEPTAGRASQGEPKAPAVKPRACPPGTQRVRTEDPFEPVKCAPPTDRSAPPVDTRRFERYDVPGQLRFEYPADWHVTNAWKDDVPSLYVEPVGRPEGKLVMLTVSRYREGSSSYVDMDTAMRREADWHGARSGGKGTVAGLPARFLEVPGETRLAYLRTGDGYFLLSFTAPEDVFKAYLPAYARLLKSFRVVHEERDPLPEQEEP